MGCAALAAVASALLAAPGAARGDPARADAADPPLPGQNLCMYGHLVPELILVGVVKGGTTTFASEVARSPSVYFATGCKTIGDHTCLDGKYNKEPHFFDAFATMGPKYMATQFPKCAEGQRMVAADMTPRYMVMPKVPGTIKSWYGFMRHRIRFVVMYREPVARFHSDYYHAINNAGIDCTTYRYFSFAQVVKYILNGGGWDTFTGGVSTCHGRLEESLYPPHLQRWFDIVASEQFTIIPFQLTISRRQELAESIWDMLGVQHGVLEHSHENSGKHPSLEEDLGAELLGQFQAKVYEEHGPKQLAHVIAANPGARLFGYAGSARDAPAIVNWLRQNW